MRRVIADDVMEMLIEDERVVEIICEDCPLNKTHEGCLVCYDFWDIHCPQRHLVMNLDDAIHATLHQYGIE